MVEELAEGARGAGAAGLLAVDVVHGRVGPEAEGEAVVDPGRILDWSISCSSRWGIWGGLFAYLPVHLGLPYDEENHIADNAEEAQQGHHVRRQPHG